MGMISPVLKVSYNLLSNLQDLLLVELSDIGVVAVLHDFGLNEIIEF